MAVNDIERSIERRAIPPEQQQMMAIEALVQTELGIVDSKFYAEYARIITAGDVADTMRADLVMWDRVEVLRQERRMTPATEIVEKAKTMVGLDEVEIRTILNEHARGFTVNLKK